MKPFYQLIDLDSGNVITDFKSEAEARAKLQHEKAIHGAEGLAALSLLIVDGENQELVAMDDDLIEWIDRDQRIAV